MKRGFTLAEVAVASVIILVVLTVLTLAIASFFRGSRQLELQEGAATLARLELAEYERQGSMPEEGTWARTDSLLGNVYQVETTVLRTGDHTSDVMVEVWSGDSVSIGFTRRFYGSNER